MYSLNDHEVEPGKKVRLNPDDSVVQTLYDGGDGLPPRSTHVLDPEELNPRPLGRVKVVDVRFDYLITRKKKLHNRNI